MREACTSLSLDEFIQNTIESLMQIEREEYLESAKNQGLSEYLNSKPYLSIPLMITKSISAPLAKDQK